LIDAQLGIWSVRVLSCSLRTKTKNACLPLLGPAAADRRTARAGAAGGWLLRINSTRSGSVRIRENHSYERRPRPASGGWTKKPRAPAAVESSGSLGMKSRVTPSGTMLRF